MTGEEFEQLIATKMQSFGWRCTSTPKSNDYGADLVCSLGAEKVLVQCKCYGDENFVGRSAVSDVYGAIPLHSATKGIVVYRGRATKQAKTLAGSTGILLFHVDELIPGWMLDRTKEGAEVRRQEEKARAYEEWLVRKRETEAYRSDLAEFERKKREWKEAAKKHRTWQAFGAAACLVALFTWGEPAPAASISWAALIFAAYAFLGTGPGSLPEPPDKPVHELVDGFEMGVDQTSRAATGSGVRPTAPGPVNMSSVPRSSRRHWPEFSLTRTVKPTCPDCGLSFSVTLHRGENQIRCPGCQELIED